MTNAPENTPLDSTPDGDSPDQPRRGASAQFRVAESAGKQAAMRHAMDPANQSLAEALRLSYRVLQVAILVLVVVFFFSGFQSVKDGQTGIKTVFGRIVGEPGQEQVSPGLQPFWPYPVGEIVLVEQKRVVELRHEFWPKLAAGSSTLEMATNVAQSGTPLLPAMDSGSLITGDGDLVHAQVVAEYAVEDSVRLLAELDPALADALVRRVLMEAMVQTAAQFTLQEFVESRDQPPQVLRALAQEKLNALKCGIQMTSVSIPEKTAPLLVRKSFAMVQAARENVKVDLQKAHQEANNEFVGVAGSHYAELLALVDQYETELTRGDLPAADAAMARIGAALEDREAGGETARIINRAQAYQGAMSAALSKESRRLQGLSASFRENPAQLVRQLWLDTLRPMLDTDLVEVFSMPTDGGEVTLALSSSEDVMQARRKAQVEEKKRRAAMAGSMDPAYQLGVMDIEYTKAGRRLKRDVDKPFR